MTTLVEITTLESPPPPPLSRDGKLASIPTKIKEVVKYFTLSQRPRWVATEPLTVRGRQQRGSLTGLYSGQSPPDHLAEGGRGRAASRRGHRLQPVHREPQQVIQRHLSLRGVQHRGGGLRRLHPLRAR